MIIENAFNKIQDKEFRRLQVITWISAFGVAAWGVAMMALGDTRDILWLRVLSVSALVILALSFNKFKKGKFSTSLYMLIAGGIVLVQGFIVSEKLDWPQTYVLIVLLTLIFVGFYISDKIILNLWNFIFAIVAAYISFRNNASHDSYYMAITCFAFLGVSYFASRSRSEVLTELQILEERNSRILSTMAEGLVIFNEENKIISINQAATLIMGLQMTDLANKTSQEAQITAFHEDGSPFQINDFPSRSVTLTGQPIRGKVIQYPDPTGEIRWLSVNADPFFLDEAKEKVGVLLTFQDVTNLKEKENTIRDQERHLASTARFTALGEMAAGIAHEVNNPLAIISGRAEQLKKILIKLENIDKDQQKIAIGFVDKIFETILRLNKIVASMKSLAREGSQDPFETVSFLQIVNDTLVVTKEKLKNAQIELRIKIPSDLQIHCRPSQISQVILNLVHNSYDAISTDALNNPTRELNSFADDKWIEIEAQKVGLGFQFSVMDSGPGIPDKIRQQIMNPFFTTKEPGKGTGLGLSITAKILKDHGGVISLDEKAKHTRFVILLPALSLPQKSA